MKLRRDPLCEKCREDGIVTEATEVHHIIPISEGGDPYSLQNLMSVCHRCHMRIHAADGEGEVKSLQEEVPETGAKYRARDREMP